MRWSWTRREGEEPEGEAAGRVTPAEPIFPSRSAAPPAAARDHGGTPRELPGETTASVAAPAALSRPIDRPPGEAPAPPDDVAARLVPLPASGAALVDMPEDATRRGMEAGEAATLVRSLYRLLLRREADEYGLEGYGAMLRDSGAGAVPAVVERLLASGERQAVEVVGAVDAALRGEVVPRFGPVRHVCSLGSTCYPAWLMQQLGLKRWSGPFDWLFGSVELVERCLEDDFAAFLDPREIEALGDGRATHRRFQPGITLGPVFNHRDATLPEHQAYHRRCVERFRALLRSPEGKCFVMLLPGHPSWPDGRLLEEFHRVGRALAGRTDNFRLLMVSHDRSDGGLSSGLREVEARPDGALYRFRSASGMQAGLSFRQEWDNLALKRLLWSNDYDLADGAP